MDKFVQMLNKKIKDETAAFAILGAMIITFAVTIGVYEYINYARLAEVNSNINMAQVEGGDIQLVNGEAQNVLGNVITNDTMSNSVIDEQKAKKENEEKYEKLKKEKKVSSAADKYYIKVNYGAQVVTVYTKDSNGKYTKPVKAMVCSTGRYTPTSGTYRTLGKGNWWGLMGGVYGQYSTWICDDILFHSVPYLEKGDKSSLEYWAYDQLGQRVSMGCVRLTVADAKWIYNNCPVGTQVEFYSSSNPGPLGKPSTRKISNAPSYVRGWDPTDSDSRNPWPKYLKELEQKEKEEKKKAEEEKKKEEQKKKEEANKQNTITNTETNTTTDKNTNTTTNTTPDKNTNTTTNTTPDKNTNTTTNTTPDKNTNTTTNTTPNKNTNTTANTTPNKNTNTTANTTAGKNTNTATAAGKSETNANITATKKTITN